MKDPAADLSSRLARARLRWSIVAPIAGFFSVMALILLVGGLIGFDGDWAAPLTVRSKNVDVLSVDAAWKYLVPVLCLSVLGAVVCLGA